MERLGFFFITVLYTQGFLGLTFWIIQFAFFILRFAWFSGEELRSFIMHLFVLFYIWLSVGSLLWNVVDICKDMGEDLSCKEEKDLSCKEKKEWEENS